LSNLKNIRNFKIHGNAGTFSPSAAPRGHLSERGFVSPLLRGSRSAGLIGTLVVASLALIAPLRSSAEQALVFIGTYTGPSSKGIYLSHFDQGTGKLGPVELAAEMTNPSFLALHPKRRFLYAVSEVEEVAGKRSGTVCAFRIAQGSGKLTLINQQPCEGAGPCHLAVDKSGKCVLVANYGGGSIAALPIQSDGGLGPPSLVVQHQGASVNAQRQSAPHAHFITTDPGDRFVLGCDLGLDKVLVYRFSPQPLSLEANDPPSVSLKPGAGPRHLAFHPNGHAVYVINELGSTVTVFAYDPRRGDLNEIQTLSTLPETFTGESFCAEIQVHPSGKFVYGSNRGDDSIAIFSTDAKTGKLSVVGYEPTGGKTPRHFALDPRGNWLLAENQASDNVVVFRVDSRTGKLTATGQTIAVGAPVCLLFVPTSSF